MSNKFFERKYLPLLSLLLIASIFSFFNYRGIDFSDEYVYSLNAWKICNGSFELTPEPFDNRFGLLYPMALFIKIFGVKPYFFPIWSSFSFILILISNYYFVHIYNRKIAILSTLLLALNPVLLELSAEVSQDLIITSFASISIFIIWKTQTFPNKYSLGSSIIFVICLFIAFATKLSSVLLGPFILYFLITDLLKKQNYKFWMNSVLLGISTLTLYFFIYYYFTDNPFYRFQGIGLNYYTYPESYGSRAPWELIARVTIFPIPFLLKSYGIGVFFLIAVLWWKKFSFSSLNKLPNFIFLYFAYLLFIHWFGSMSLTNYNPITFSERMWLLLVPPLVILSAFSIEQILPNLEKKEKNWVLIYLGSIIGLCTIGLYLAKDKYPWFLLPLIVSILIIIWLKWKPNNQYILPILIILPFFLLQLNTISNYKKNTPFFYQQDFLETLSDTKNHLIYSDRNLAEMYDIYFQFSPPQNIVYRRWETADSSDISGFDKFYVVYDRKKKLWLEDFLKLKVPGFVKNDTIGNQIMDNEYLKIKEISASEMKKIRRFEE